MLFLLKKKFFEKRKAKESGAHHPLCSVIKLGIRHPRKKDKRKM